MVGGFKNLAKKKSSLNIQLIISVVAILLAIVGFCMVFTNGFIFLEKGASGFGISVSGKTEYPGLGVVFGGTHDVLTSVSTSAGVGTTQAVSTEFKFNFVGCCSFVLALVGATLGFLGGKNKLFNFVAFVVSLAAVVMVFFVVNGYAASNSSESIKIDPSKFKWGATYIIAIVCFVLETLCLAGKTFLSFKK